MSKQDDVGYGKPPTKHQFKKGKSGNPSGRPKRPKLKPLLDFEQNLIAELKSLVTIIEDGKKKKITKLEAIQKSVIAQALKGDKTATKLVVNYLQKLPKYAFEDQEITWVVKSDLEVIDKWLNECEANSDQKQGNGPSSVEPATDNG
jgi:Family of unknown function (DUF5681)